METAIKLHKMLRKMDHNRKANSLLRSKLNNLLTSDLFCAHNKVLLTKDWLKCCKKSKFFHNVENAGANV